jgi:hypothetical protein
MWSPFGLISAKRSDFDTWGGFDGRGAGGGEGDAAGLGDTVRDSVGAAAVGDDDGVGDMTVAVGWLAGWQPATINSTAIATYFMPPSTLTPAFGFSPSRAT